MISDRQANCNANLPPHTFRKPLGAKTWLACIVAACVGIGSVAHAQDNTRPFPTLKNLAQGAAVQLNTAPSYPDTTDAGDATQLVDGQLAAKQPMWYDAAAVGWMGESPAEFTVDLGADQPIGGAAIRFGAGQSGVEWPASVEILTSVDGKQFTPAGDLMQHLAKKPPAKGYADLWLAANSLKTHGRYVKFVATPTNRGTGSYIIIDELEIYRGDEAFMQIKLSGVSEPTDWIAPLDQITWKPSDALNTAERPKNLTLIDGKTETGADVALHDVEASAGGVSFTLNGEVGQPRSMQWVGKLPEAVATTNCRYALITLSADGIRRTYEERALIALQGISSDSSDNIINLVNANLLPNDGRARTLVTRLPEGFTVQQINVLLLTESEHPHLTIEKLQFLSSVPETFTTEVASAAATVPAGLEQVDIAPTLNGNLTAWFDGVLEKYKTVVNGVRVLEPGVHVISGIPFNIAAGENNLAIMNESPQSDERIKFLGYDMDRRYLEPESRHDTLSFDVDATASEAYLLLGLSAPAVQILGGQPHIPMHLDDIEVITVELTYDKGDAETAFPYSVADRGCYIPARGLGAYAVAVDPSRRLKKITLHARQFGPNFAVAGLTLNTSVTPLIPELAAVNEPERVTHNEDPAAQPVTIDRQGDHLSIRNRWYEYEFDLADGFTISKAVNRWNSGAPVSLNPNSGLRLRVGENIYTGRSFKAKVDKITPASVQLTLTSARAELPLTIELAISADDSSNLTFVAKTTNTGSKPIASELMLPALVDLSIDSVEKMRLFFPQYRNVDTGERIALRAPYGPEYTQQFMDIYSRSAGVGFTIRTNNTEQQMVHFNLRKDDTGVSGGVTFPADYNNLDPRKSHTYIPVSIVAHNGDWRTAFNEHRDWLNTWYKPVHAQDKDYLLNAWEIACYRTSDHISWLEQKAPPFVSKDKTKWETDGIFAFEKESRGHYPDIVHFFHWTYNDDKKQSEFGHFSGDVSYDQIGGLERFRKGIADIQDNWKMPLSLYVIADRLRISNVPDQKLVQELIDIAHYKVMDTDTSSGLRAAKTLDGIIYPAVGHPGWLKFFHDDIIKMQKDTDCKLVYIDVFATWSHLKGYNGISPREVDMQMLTGLRKDLPADVALWSEYPPSDVAAQYQDGSLQYYFLPLHEVFARQYNLQAPDQQLYREAPMNIGRYVLPKYKSIGLAVYIEAANNPSAVDMMMFNGEANQEDTWRLHHSRIRERLNRAYDIKRKYNDCFTTLTPQPKIDTLVEGIAANAFPGKNRIAYTLYNGRAKTYTGNVLLVPHKAGAKYRDAWRNVEISPEIENGMAKIPVNLDPQQPGCVIQDWN